MNSIVRRQALVLLAAITLTLLSTELVFTQQRSLPGSLWSAPLLPNPVLYPIIQEPFTTGGKNFIRYRYAVLNFDSYPNEMFAAAPELPPCGKNAKSARTWVDIYDQRGTRLYGFCALGKNSDLNQIWFAMEEGVIPPSYIYIELNDRKTNTKYRSNLAETTQ
ncbi:MAG TPA: hypothetical protein VM095_03175 [Pyrinomonadaceae bacterium]|nr:hypothetical protein [Pyrinomonadaceae bacterium]